MKPWAKRGLIAGAAVIAIWAAAEMVYSMKPVERTDFSGTTLAGERWSLAEHRGRHPIVVNFFATW